MSYRLLNTAAFPIAVGLVLGLAPGFNAVMAQDVDIQSVTQIKVQSPSYRPPEVDQLFRDMGLGQEFVFTQAEEKLWHLANANSSSRLANCREIARDEQSVTWLCGVMHINANLPNKRVTANQFQHLIGTVTDATETLPVAPIAKGVVRQSGQPVVNATVKQKATSRQTTTDAGGQYELEVTDDAAILVVSYPGTAPHEVAINTGTLSDNVYTLDVTLEESVTRIVVEAPSSRAPAVDQILREMTLGRQYILTMTEESTWQLTNTGSTSLLAVCREIIRMEQGIELSCGSRIMQVNLSTKQVVANRQHVIGTVSEVGQSEFLAATTRVKGVVRQTSTGKPVREATVSEKGQSRTVSTDALGEYELEVTHADAMLVVSFPGAQETEQAVSAGAVADNVYTLDISLGCLQGTDWYAGDGHGCLVPDAPLPVRGGVMQDESRRYIPGAAVTEKGTSNTTTTNSAGQYAIDVQNADAVLVFTYPGAASQEIPLRYQGLIGSNFVINAPMACAPNKEWVGDTCELAPCPAGQQRFENIYGNRCVIVQQAEVIVETPPECLEGQHLAADNTCVSEVFIQNPFVGDTGQIAVFARERGWVVASRDEVQAAWEKLGFATPRAESCKDARGRYLTPVQTDMPPYYTRGLNETASIGPNRYCFFYVLETAAGRVQPLPSWGTPTYPAWWPKAIDTLPNGLLPGSTWQRVPAPGYGEFWSSSLEDQHLARIPFGLGDAVLLREAAGLQLQSKGQAATTAAVEALLDQLQTDPVARFQFAPFLLQVTFEALSTPSPDAGQAAFRGAFEQYMSYNEYTVNGITYNRWREHNGERPFLPVEEYNPYSAPAANFLPKIPDVTGFQSSLTNPMYIGNDGLEAIRVLLAPAAMASLPEFKNSPLGQLGTDLEAVAAGVIVGTAVGNSAATLGLVSSAVFGYTATLSTVSTTAIVGGTIGTSTTAITGTITPSVLVSSFPGSLAPGATSSLASSAGIGIGISLALGALIGKAFADVARADQLDRELREALDAGPVPVDVYALVNAPDEGVRRLNRSAVFSYLLKMLIAGPADKGLLTLAMPKIPCGPGEKKSETQMCFREVMFHAEPGLTLQQAQALAQSNGWQLARAHEVENAWSGLKLDVYAFGMMSDGRFAVPVQSNHSNFLFGPNIGATGGNQGFFYTQSTSR